MAKWLLSSAAREMHTCTLDSYLITREGCTAALHTAPGLQSAYLGLKSSSLACVLAWVSYFPPLFEKEFQKATKMNIFATPNLGNVEINGIFPQLSN